MADSNGKEHDVVIVNCSRECHVLPLDVDLWVHFVPDLCGAVCRVHVMIFFTPCTAFPKQIWFFSAVFAIFICWTVYVSFFHCNSYDPL